MGCEIFLFLSLLVDELVKTGDCVALDEAVLICLWGKFGSLLSVIRDWDMPDSV